MSYSRGEVYVFGDGNKWECCGCKFIPRTKIVQIAGKEFLATESFYAKTKEEMLEHMLEHQRAGHAVSYSGIERMKQEIQGHYCSTDELWLKEDNDDGSYASVYHCSECRRTTIEIGFGNNDFTDSIHVEPSGKVVLDVPLHPHQVLVEELKE